MGPFRIVRSDRLLVVLAALSVFSAEPARGADLRMARQALDQSYAAQLEELAARCEQLGLVEQAQSTRDWIVQRDPGRQYIFLTTETGRAPSLASEPKLVQQWQARLLSYRQAQAQRLFELARSAVASEPATAYRWLHEVLREDPLHAEARQILGFRLVNNNWRRSERAVRVRQGTSPHPQLAWPRRSYWWVESEHYRIATNHSPEAGAELAAQLEQLHDVWQQLFFDIWSRDGSLAARFSGSDASLGSGGRHQVVLFRDRPEYAAQLQTIEPQIAVSLGYYSEPLQTAFFYWGDEASRPTWYHEATHQLFQERPNVVSPVGEQHHVWALEGAALYMESLRQLDGYVTLGGFDAERLQFARYRALNERYYVPLQQLVQYGRQQLQQDEDIRRLYTQAAGLAHFLMDYEQGRYGQAFRHYLDQLYSGQDQADTLTQLTQVSWGELDQQYHHFLQVTDADLQRLAQGPQLTSLCLGHTAVTDQGLAVLANQTQLRWLDLAYTATSDSGLQHLSNARSLRQLNLEHTPMTDAALQVVQQFRQLEELDLSGTQVTDAGLRLLTDLENLKVLWLTSTKITDAGLPVLADLKRLEMLDISDTAVTPAAWNQLKTQLPALSHE